MAIGTIPKPHDPPAEGEPKGLYEVVNGQVVEKPEMGVSEGEIATELSRLLGNYSKEHRLGRVLVEVLFVIDRARDLQRRPDVAYVSKETWPLERRAPQQNAWDVIPDLAVEIISPSNTTVADFRKLVEYFQSGVRLVWIILPEQKQVYAYDSPMSVRIFGQQDELDGGAVLPGFRLPLSALFEDEAEPLP